MPKLKIDDEELPDDLDEVEYETGGNFTRYEGEIPPRDTVLSGFVKAMWWTYTKDESPMLKVLVEAAGNNGDEEEYNGCPFWENLALTAKAKFKWGPFFEHFGLTIRMVKTKTMLVGDSEDDDDAMGAPIKKIGTFVPGEDSDTAWCRFVTTTEKYNGKLQPHVAEWLDHEAPDEDEEDLDEDEDLEDEDEEEEPPPPPRRSAKKPAAASTTKTSARPKAAARPSARSAPAKAASAKAGRPARKAGRAAGYDEEPPF